MYKIRGHIRSHIFCHPTYFEFFSLLEEQMQEDNCSTQDLQPSLWPAKPFVVACKLLVEACDMYFPDQELNPGPTALGVWSLSPWTTREVPVVTLACKCWLYWLHSSKQEHSLSRPTRHISLWIF